MRLSDLNPSPTTNSTSTELFYSDDYATIEFDRSIPCVKVTLNGVPRYSEHYHFVQTKRLELLRREINNYARVHMLTDSSNAGVVLDEDVAHFRTRVLPEMENAGVRCLAIVLPESKFTQLTIMEMTQNTQHMQVRYFESMREAKSWLKKMSAE